MANAKPTLVNLETQEEITAFGVPEGLSELQGARWSHASSVDAGVSWSDYLGGLPEAFALKLTFENVNPGSNPGDVRPQA